MKKRTDSLIALKSICLLTSIFFAAMFLLMLPSIMRAQQAATMGGTANTRVISYQGSITTNIQQIAAVR